MPYLIYGKLNKPIFHKGKWVGPHAKFAALNYKGERCTKLADADDYATRADAEEAVKKAKEYWSSKGKDDMVSFDIRKAK